MTIVCLKNMEKTIIHEAAGFMAQKEGDTTRWLLKVVQSLHWVGTHRFVLLEGQTQDNRLVLLTGKWPI